MQVGLGISVWVCMSIGKVYMCVCVCVYIVVFKG